MIIVHGKDVDSMSLPEYLRNSAFVVLLRARVRMIGCRMYSVHYAETVLYWHPIY